MPPPKKKKDPIRSSSALHSESVVVPASDSEEDFGSGLQQEQLSCQIIHESDDDENQEAHPRGASQSQEGMKQHTHKDSGEEVDPFAEEEDEDLFPAVLSDDNQDQLEEAASSSSTNVGKKTLSSDSISNMILDFYEYEPVGQANLAFGVCSQPRFSPRSKSSTFHQIWKKLLCFQQDAVKFATQNHGRILLADEMGLGKTISAIAIACYYAEDWPVLVIAPSSVRGNWVSEFQMWAKKLMLGGVSKFNPLGASGSACVLMDGKSKFKLSRVVVISYDLIEKFHDQLTQSAFKIVICDESHYLKSPRARRTLLTIPLLHAAKRAVLLTGTPALSRPYELFTQFHAIKPAIFKSLRDFSNRYCQGQDERKGSSNASAALGGSHLDELHQRAASFMLRRLKSHVLDLPEKVRSVVTIETASAEDPAPVVDTASLQQLVESSSSTTDVQGQLIKSMKDKVGFAKFTQLYQSSGLAKVSGVQAYIEALLQQHPKSKFLVFGHHSAVLDALSSMFKKCGMSHVRIDGSVAGEDRQELVKMFQEDPACRAAVLSITAGGQGITLTAANFVVFAEIYWNPGHLLQAEDRAHRLGQTKTTYIHYLLSSNKNSIDQLIWPLLSQKLEVLGQTLHGVKGQTFMRPELEMPSEDAARYKKVPLAAIKGSNKLMDAGSTAAPSATVKLKAGEGFLQLKRKALDLITDPSSQEASKAAAKRKKQLEVARLRQQVEQLKRQLKEVSGT